MRFRSVALVVLVSGLALAGCSTPPAPTESNEPAPVAVPPIEGEWTMTRTLAETTVDREGSEIGFEQVRILNFSDVTCESDGACTGLVNSRNPETESEGVEAEFTIADGVMRYEFEPTPQDCTTIEGEVLFAEAWTNSTTQEVEIPQDAEEFDELTGTALMTVEAAQGAIDAGCGAGGERVWDMVLERVQ